MKSEIRPSKTAATVAAEVAAGVAATVAAGVAATVAAVRVVNEPVSKLAVLTIKSREW